MRLYKRGKIWWYEFDFNRKQIRRSSKTKNRTLAGQIASVYHTALVKGEVGIVDRKPVPSFSDAMTAFLAWSTLEHHAHPRTSIRYNTSSKPLLRFFKATPIDTITPEEVERYKSARSSEKGKRTARKLRPATVNRELACLRAMFNHVLKGDVLLRNPVSRVKFLAEDNQQDRVVKFAEQRKYLAKATPALRDVAGLILETGMRPEEVYTLRVSSVDVERGWLRVLKGKTPAARRQIELTAEAARILEERIGKVKTGYLFPHERNPELPMPKINNAHDRAVKESGVPHFRLYDLRHTWATRAAESGIDLVTLAAMMGHSRIQMVMRYAHPTQKHQTSAMQKLEAHSAAAEEREKVQDRLAEERRAGGPKLTLIRRPA